VGGAGGEQFDGAQQAADVLGSKGRGHELIIFT
jgi:hypothetical protein